MDSSFDGAERRYRYNARGDLNGLSVGDSDLGFRTDPLGRIGQVNRDGDNAIRIEYSDADRVETLRFDLGDDGASARYRYDRAGFRVAGHYDVLGQAEVALEYDSAGNIVRIEMPGPGGAKRVTEHTIGSENELLGVTPLSAPTFGQTFEYDGSGRAVGSAQGNGREAAFRYDELGRLTDVYLDGEHVLTSDHGPMDPDPVHATDARTALTAIADPVASAVFGSLDEIVYTRSYGTPYGFARFAPEMGRFVVADRAVVPPDALMLASLRRRNMATEAILDPSPLQGFDKLSSSLFLPPEFFASNCAYCVGGVTAFRIDRVGSSPVVTGQTVTFVADGSSDYCDYVYYDDDLDYPIPENYTIVPRNFTHEVDFVGGSGDATYSTGSARLEFSGSFSSPGTKTVRDTLSCGCGGIFLAQAETAVSVAEPSCSVDFSLSSADNFRISAAPRMPAIDATVTALYPGDASVSWSASVAHTAPSGCTGGPTFSASVSGSGSSFSPAFPGFYGGDLTVTATCSAPGYASTASTRTATITGTQPGDGAIVGRLGTMSSPFEPADLRRISCAESGMTQFRSNGFPVYGPGGDAGLMQICYFRRNSDLWDWTANIARGRSILTTASNSARNHLDGQVNEGATPYTTDMWREESIHRYNAGTRAGDEYWEWIPDPFDEVDMGEWMIVDRGGIGGYVPRVTGQSSTCT